MKILVTGGAGFIGSHLVQRLTAEGHTVSIIDDLNDFYSPAFKLENLDEIGLAGSERFHQGDICDATFVGTVFAQEQPDAVIHLAARAGVRPSLEDPLLYEHVNVRGTVTLLEACRHTGTRKFVFASSSSIYGIANQVPFSEEDLTNLPISPYAATKIAGEKLCFTWSHLYGLNVVCLRFFTVYGPRQRPDLAIRKFIERIDSGRTIPVFGDGGTGRDYTFVADTVQGIVAALHHDTRFDVFNLGNSSPITLARLIEVIEDAVGKKAKIDRQPDQPGDVPITFADISKARRVLAYDPKTPIEQGIARFVEWHRRRLVRQ
ncbi:MAG: GDP-mannose 4,6-dehydratase [Bryobacterales bacterium]|nr:GDP-mannose 4,6-dehydratase [Bryobacterales bacterium]